MSREKVKEMIQVVQSKTTDLAWRLGEKLELKSLNNEQRITNIQEWCL